MLIKNGTIHDGKGSIFYNYDILIEDGKIKEIGKNINAGYSSEIYDASNRHIMPGFIESMNIWGCTGPGWGDNDLQEHSDPLTPQLNVVYSFDPDNMMFQRVFEYGITSLAVTPSLSNVLSGNAAVFKTYGNNAYNMLIKEKIGLVGSVTRATTRNYKDRGITPMTKMGIFSLLKETFKEAEDYSQSNTYNSKLYSVKEVIDNNKKLFINCNTASEMFNVYNLFKQFKVDPIIMGAYGINEELVDTILNNDYSVIIGDVINGISEASKKIDYKLIEKLVENEALVAISSTGDRMSSGKETLLWNAIMFYKNGINSENVLKMITYNPAKILGVENRVGSIEVGKDADIVVWSNNPIESYNSKAEAVLINGENIINVWRTGSCW